MNKTKIEWCDMTWNPVTGCYHECKYCYAENIAKRFGIKFHSAYGEVYELDEPYLRTISGCEKRKIPYPYGFDPTFHRYRLDEPAHTKKPQNIFVCSMADLFGDWIPDEWIKQVFESCEKAPQHRYLFLTKNPKRYLKLAKNDQLPKTGNFWFGTTVTRKSMPYFYAPPGKQNTFLSIEPIQEDFERRYEEERFVNWVIIGAETGNRKGGVIPKREWIEYIVNRCKEKNVPVFMKSSLANIWRDPLIQEYPWMDL